MTSCPRRKVVRVEHSRDVTVDVVTLTMECGHEQERRYVPRGWKAPKTTRCGMCWRISSRGLENEQEDGKQA
jgi:hypothetical protein